MSKPRQPLARVAIDVLTFAMARQLRKLFVFKGGFVLGFFDDFNMARSLKGCLVMRLAPTLGLSFTDVLETVYQIVAVESRVLDEHAGATACGDLPKSIVVKIQALGKQNAPGEWVDLVTSDLELVSQPGLGRFRRSLMSNDEQASSQTTNLPYGGDCVNAALGPRPCDLQKMCPICCVEDDPAERICLFCCGHMVHIHCLATFITKKIDAADGDSNTALIPGPTRKRVITCIFCFHRLVDVVCDQDDTLDPTDTENDNDYDNDTDYDYDNDDDDSTYQPPAHERKRD